MKLIRVTWLSEMDLGDRIAEVTRGEQMAYEMECAGDGRGCDKYLFSIFSFGKHS
jgi:hypothetical protein